MLIISTKITTLQKLMNEKNDMKNNTHYYFNDVININYLDLDNILLEKNNIKHSNLSECIENSIRRKFFAC